MKYQINDIFYHNDNRLFLYLITDIEENEDEEQYYRTKNMFTEIVHLLTKEELDQHFQRIQFQSQGKAIAFLTQLVQLCKDFHVNIAPNDDNFVEFTFQGEKPDSVFLAKFGITAYHMAASKHDMVNF